MDWSRKCGEEAEAEAETASKQQTGRTKCTTDYNLACSLSLSASLSVSLITGFELCRRARSGVGGGNTFRLRRLHLPLLPSSASHLLVCALRFFSISFAVRALLF